MTASTRTQLRGNCQHCGRDQAVTRGRMAQHGYTLDYGYFNGVCNGHRHAPLQAERQHADLMVISVKADIAEMTAKIADLKAGRLHPATVETSLWDAKARKAVSIDWAMADEYQREGAVKSAIWKLESRIRGAESFVTDFSALIERVHGTALREVSMEKAPAIKAGEQRDFGTDGKVNIVTCHHVEGPRVYWNCTRANGTVGQSWTGTQAWRKGRLVAPKPVEAAKPVEAPKAAEAAKPATVTVAFKVSRGTLVDVLTTATECAYSWFEFRNVKRIPENAEDRALFVTACRVVEVDCDDEGQVLSKHDITPDNILAAMVKIAAGGVCSRSVTADVQHAMTHNDAGQIDADSADCILQIACLGEIRYG